MVGVEDVVIGVEYVGIPTCDRGHRRMESEDKESEVHENVSDSESEEYKSDSDSEVYKSESESVYDQCGRQCVL